MFCYPSNTLKKAYLCDHQEKRISIHAVACHLQNHHDSIVYIDFHGFQGQELFNCICTEHLVWQIVAMAEITSHYS